MFGDLQNAKKVNKLKHVKTDNNTSLATDFSLVKKNQFNNQ